MVLREQVPRARMAVTADTGTKGSTASAAAGVGTGRQPEALCGAVGTNRDGKLQVRAGSGLGKRDAQQRLSAERGSVSMDGEGHMAATGRTEAGRPGRSELSRQRREGMSKAWGAQLCLGRVPKNLAGHGARLRAKP